MDSNCWRSVCCDCVWILRFVVHYDRDLVTMIRFVIGMLGMIAGVAAAEGTAGLGTAILLATAGVIIMLWGLLGMAKKGQLA